MKTEKRILAAVLIMALLTALTGCSTYPDVTIDLTTGEVKIDNPAVSSGEAEYNEAEPAGVQGELLYWSEDSAAAASIRDYVAEVTDINSDKYIPIEDRIAVFDMDGTLIGELYPSYFEYMMFIHRALHDDTYEAPDDMREFAEALEEGVYGGQMPENCERLHAKYAGQSYAGMTIDEMKDYTRAFMQTGADGFTNLTKGDAFYWPMVSLVQYLTDNDFTCYVVSGSDRTLCRTIIEDWLPIPENRVIGMSYTMVASGQGDTDGLEYVYSADDKLIRGGDLIIKTIKMNKVSVIAQEIGKVPVLSFGNSSGDVSMAQYVINNDQYETKAFMLMCDDLVREHGNMDKANAMLDTCNERGFEPISMRDDFATIYGDEVEPVDYEGPEGEALEPAA
ncbi:MAG: haloacid dehalogenase-like hydrolase [Lachnospiraceae bacterium]|nr:haloacid dehalogenase-like hydrolase [Lachnospiraceae bacterium]